MNGFARHIAACNNVPAASHARLAGRAAGPARPEGLLPFRLGGAEVGWVAPPLAAALVALPLGFALEGDGVAGAAPALDQAVTALAAQGFFRRRGELFDLRATPDGPVVGVLDRGAIPAFGAIGQGVHLNGLVRRADGLHLWVGIRSRTKAVAPGQLDNLVAGGTPAGLDAWSCLIKEAAEEASIPVSLARQARPVGRLSYVLRLAEGLRRDVLHCFDLELPADFVPVPGDDEVERFELWPARRVLEAVRDGDAVKFNVNLVLIDLFLREGLIDAGSTEGRTLRAGLEQGV